MAVVPVQELRKGNRLALSRILTQVEGETEVGKRVLEELFPFTGHAHKVGITGPPGSGKSTLVNALAKFLRLSPTETNVAIIAVDPTSPFSGGAILGDRVRMQDLQGDPGIFIRSMATRGALGGISEKTEAFGEVFDAAGFDYVLIETVGAGQSEVEIASLAHTTVVVDTPDMGDDIQAIKAGILEVADIFVINKADHSGAERSVQLLEQMLSMGHVFNQHDSGHAQKFTAKYQRFPTESLEAWEPPVLKTIATESAGVEDLARVIGNHATWLRKSGLWNSKDEAILRQNLKRLLTRELYQSFLSRVPPALLEEQIQDMLARRISPRQALGILLAYNQTQPNSSLE